MSERNPPVMLVEDEPLDAQWFVRCLKQLGIVNAVVRFAEPQRARDFLLGRPPYTDRRTHPLPVLIALDLRLPGGDGYDVLRSVRQEGDLGNIPVVVISSSSDPAEIRRAYDQGADAYLVKPIDSDTLLRALHDLNISWLLLPHSVG
ncbi:MAG: response regulator [Planctomycetota bacterium]|nr:MAG: response regulator [Planctomycetota bacterium]